MACVVDLRSVTAENRHNQKIAGIGAFALLFLSLATNQIFHNGVWGKLHNKSVKHRSRQTILYGLSVEGADVYGSFLIGITLKDKDGNVILDKDAEALSRFPVSDIQNRYIAKVAPGKHTWSYHSAAKQA